MSGLLTIGEVVAAIGRSAPWVKAADWDPVGLQLGDPARLVETMAVCHEVTNTVVDAALDAGHSLLIAYHPLLFKPTTRVTAGAGPIGRAFRMLQGGIGLAVVHTNFDVAAGGTADALAETFDLEDVAGFGPLWPAESAKVVTFAPGAYAEAVTAAMAAAGAGTIGNYTACSFRAEGVGTFFAGEGTSPVAGSVGALNAEDEVRIEMVATQAVLGSVVAALVGAHPYEEPAYDVYDRSGDAGFVGRIGTAGEGLRLGKLRDQVIGRLGGVVRVAGDLSASVRRVAVLPGSGGDFIEAAAALGADVLITGDVSHHRARAALDRGLAVIDPGHVATERPGVRRLYASVAGIVGSAEDLTGLDIGPWLEDR